MQRNECKPGTEVIIRGTIKEEALRKAQELYDELNRKHQESLNA